MPTRKSSDQHLIRQVTIKDSFGIIIYQVLYHLDVFEEYLLILDELFFLNISYLLSYFIRLQSGSAQRFNFYSFFKIKVFTFFFFVV